MSAQALVSPGRHGEHEQQPQGCQPPGTGWVETGYHGIADPIGYGWVCEGRGLERIWPQTQPRPSSQKS